jgi:hypothetical protein
MASPLQHGCRLEHDRKSKDPRLASYTFDDQGSKTSVRLIWIPFEANDAELACFASAVGQMGQGWESGYAIMDELLTELQA